VTFDLASRHRDEGILEVVLRGRLDAAAADRFDEAMAPLLAARPRALHLDMSELSYISSLGIGAVIRARRDVNAHGGRVALIGLQPAVRKVFEIVALLPEESLFTSVAEADRYFDAIQRRVREGDSSD